MIDTVIAGFRKAARRRMSASTSEASDNIVHPTCRVKRLPLAAQPAPLHVLRQGTADVGHFDSSPYSLSAHTSTRSSSTETLLVQVVLVTLTLMLIMSPMMLSLILIGPLTSFPPMLPKAPVPPVSSKRDSGSSFGATLPTVTARSTRAPRAVAHAICIVERRIRSVEIKSLNMKVAFVLALTVALLVCNVSVTKGAAIPGFGGLPDLANMGHGFGAKIGNIIKGNTYDGLERALRKISVPGRGKAHSSAESDDDSDGDSDSSMFVFSGKQLEQLITMLQEPQSGAPKQQAVPFAAIDNSVD
uniref:Uncharacterized protein n=1 Tax=Anopheles atroparvus TaxID=41427 RepID=A0A182ILZ9_ANOAO